MPNLKILSISALSIFLFSSSFVSAQLNKKASFTKIESSSETSGMQPGHAYSVTGTYESGGETYVVLRNPWGGAGDESTENQETSKFSEKKLSGISEQVFTSLKTDKSLKDYRNISGQKLKEAFPDIDDLQKAKLTYYVLNKSLQKLESEMEEVRNSRAEYKTMFENFDQKANQLFNILSTVLKAIKEMESAVTRNIAGEEEESSSNHSSEDNNSSGTDLTGNSDPASSSNDPGTELPSNEESSDNNKNNDEGQTNPYKDWTNPDKDWVNPDKDWVYPDKDKVYH